MNPKEKIIESLNGLEWRKRPEGIYADAQIPDIDGFEQRAVIHLGATLARRQIAGTSDAWTLHFYEKDLPKLAGFGLKFPGSDELERQRPR